MYGKNRLRRCARLAGTSAAGVVAGAVASKAWGEAGCMQACIIRRFASMNPWVRKSAPAVALLACAAPLFALTVRGWSPAMLFLACALAIALIAAGRLPAIEADAIGPARLVIVALAAPLAATIISAAVRG